MIDEPNEIDEQPDALELDQCKGEVVFENVGFSYQEGQPILQGLNFRVAPGQTVALIGPTGSGKSTVTNLIPRFYNATEGRVLVDGHDVKDLQFPQPAPACGHCAARPVPLWPDDWAEYCLRPSHAEL
jgi:ABC-type multidrug transport system fused ATPase/permease subunit